MVAQVSKVVANCVLDQINFELEAVAGAKGTVSGLLGDGVQDGAVRHVSAYVSCPDCARAEVHVANGSVPLLLSDARSILGVTGDRLVSLFWISKYDLRATFDMVDLLVRFVSPLFGVTASA